MNATHCPCGAPLPNDGVFRRFSAHGPEVCSPCWRRGSDEHREREALRTRLTWLVAGFDAEQVRQLVTLAEMLDAEARAKAGL